MAAIRQQIRDALVTALNVAPFLAAGGFHAVDTRSPDTGGNSFATMPVGFLAILDEAKDDDPLRHFENRFRLVAALYAQRGATDDCDDDQILLELLTPFEQALLAARKTQIGGLAADLVPEGFDVAPPDANSLLSVQYRMVVIYQHHGDDPEVAYGG